MRKEIGLPATVRLTLSSVEVMRVGAWNPGHLQPSAASPRRLGRAGSEDSCSGPGGDVWSLEGNLGNWPSNVPLCHSWFKEPEGASGLGKSQPSGLLCHIWSRAGGFLSLSVDGALEPCRAEAKRWHLAWPQWASSSFACSSSLLKILKAKFKRSYWRG